MNNPAWGTKRICQACAAKYYDFDRLPIVCPKCQTVFDPASGHRLRSDPSYKPHGGRAKSIFGKTAPRGAAEDEREQVVEEESDEKELPDGDEDTVEDVAELGDDSDDMAEIVEPEDHVER